MKEMTKELVEETRLYYAKYKNLVNQKAELTKDNKALKSDFVDINFEDEETEDKKRIKKEITKYFNTIIETDSGSEPVIEVRGLRKDHLDFEDDLYDQLMTIYKQFIKNIEAKDALDDKIEKEIYIEFCGKLGVSLGEVKGIFKLWKDFEDGKFPEIVSIVDNYRTLIKYMEG